MSTDRLAGCLTLKESLRAAVEANDTGFVKEYIAGIYGETQETGLQDALMAVADYGNADFVDILLDCNVSVVTTDEFGRTLFFSAANDGHTEFVKRLLIRGFPVSSHKDGIKALRCACQSGYVELVRVILAFIDRTLVNTVWPHDTLLSITIRGQTHGNKEIIKMLLEAGADVNLMSLSGWSALHIASRRNDSEMVQLLLEAGANANTQCQKVNKITPFGVAYNKGSAENMKLLIQYGAEPCTQDPMYHILFRQLFQQQRTSSKTIALYHANRMDFRILKLLYSIRAFPYPGLHSVKELVTCHLNRTDLKELLEEMTCTPRSLQSACRLAVRAAMRVRTPDGIYRLPLPEKLKNYMLFSDI